MNTFLPNYIVGDTRPLGISTPGLVSPNYSWEEVATLNLGVDIDLFESRLTTAFDLYTRETKNMLTLGRELPAVLGVSEPRENAADLETKGWELSLHYRDYTDFMGSPLSYGLRFTVMETDDDDLYKPRNSREYVIDRIFEDYQFAADHVHPDAPVGAVDNWTVRTFMARHALHEGTFRKYHDYLGLPYERFLEIARNQAEQVMESGRFEIYSTGDPESEYGSLFSSDNLVGDPGRAHNWT